MTFITSPSNERIRRVQALQRGTRRRLREGLLVAEGLRLVQEALRSQLPLTELFHTPDLAADPAGQQLLEGADARDVPRYQVAPELMATLSDTQTPQGILAVLPIPELPAPAGAFALIPDGIRDPGNLGTILRTAWAAGVPQVLLPPGNVDVTNPKVVRSGMGAHFFLPIRQVDWDVVRDVVGVSEIWLAEAGAGARYDRVDWCAAGALIVGGEARGAGSRALALATGRVHIPMAPGVDSLNAAVATAVLLFEILRQRSDA